MLNAEQITNIAKEIFNREDKFKVKCNNDNSYTFNYKGKSIGKLIDGEENMSFSGGYPKKENILSPKLNIVLGILDSSMVKIDGGKG